MFPYSQGFIICMPLRCQILSVSEKWLQHIMYWVNLLGGACVDCGLGIGAKVWPGAGVWPGPGVKYGAMVLWPGLGVRYGLGLGVGCGPPPV